MEKSYGICANGYRNQQGEISDGSGTVESFVSSIVRGCEVRSCSLVLSLTVAQKQIDVL
jgi:hypothetical protein